MTTQKQCRCKDCAYLVEGDDGSWICDGDVPKNIEDIPDEECPAEKIF